MRSIITKMTLGGIVLFPLAEDELDRRGSDNPAS